MVTPTPNFPSYTEEPESRPTSPKVSPTENADLPSRAFPWLVTALTVVALFLQGNGLVQLLKVDSERNSFLTKVAAWEEGSGSREKVLDEWRKLESESHNLSDEARSRLAVLKGSTDASQKQYSEISQSLAEQTKLLESLKSQEALVRSSHDNLKEETEALKKQKTGIDNALKSLKSEGRELKDSVATLKSTNLTAEEELAANKRLVTAAEQRLKDIESQLTKLDMLLLDKTKISTELQLQLDSAKMLSENNSKAKTDLQSLESKIAQSEADHQRASDKLQALTTKLAKLQATEESQTNRVKDIDEQFKQADARLANLRKVENELNQRITDSTKALNTSSEEAAASLSDLSKKTAQAISDMAIQAAKFTELIKSLSEAKKEAQAPVQEEPKS